MQVSFEEVVEKNKMRRRDKMFRPKCPYCRGKNLYLKRTSPMEKYGCRDCEKKAKYLEEQGLSRNQIMKALKM